MASRDSEIVPPDGFEVQSQLVSCQGHDRVTGGKGEESRRERRAGKTTCLELCFRGPIMPANEDSKRENNATWLRP